MQIKNGKDFWAGLMYMGFGIFFMVIARNYTCLLYTSDAARVDRADPVVQVPS